MAYVTCAGETGNKLVRLVSDFISSVAGINNDQYLINSTMQPTLNGRQVLIDIQLLHLTVACP